MSKKKVTCFLDNESYRYLSKMSKSLDVSISALIKDSIKSYKKINRLEIVETFSTKKKYDILLSEDEYKLISDSSANLGLSRSTFIRVLVQNSYGNRSDSKKNKGLKSPIKRITTRGAESLILRIINKVSLQAHDDAELLLNQFKQDYLGLINESRKFQLSMELLNILVLTGRLSEICEYKQNYIDNPNEELKNDRLLNGLFNLGMARWLYRTDELVGAHVCTIKAIEYLLSVSEPAVISHCYRMLAKIAVTRMDFSAAAKFYERAVSFLDRDEIFLHNAVKASELAYLDFSQGDFHKVNQKLAGLDIRKLKDKSVQMFHFTASIQLRSLICSGELNSAERFLERISKFYNISPGATIDVYSSFIASQNDEKQLFKLKLISENANSKFQMKNYIYQSAMYLQDHPRYQEKGEKGLEEICASDSPELMKEAAEKTLQDKCLCPVR